MFARIKKFIKEARQEFRHVNWPTPREAARLTAVVIGISLGVAAFLGFFDFVFANLIRISVVQ